MKAKDIRELSLEEAAKKLRDLREQIVRLRVQKQAGQVENPAEHKNLRREIARFETILKAKKREAAA